MGLPERFDNRLRRDLGLRAAWLPGNKFELGDVLQLDQGIFQRVTALSDFEIDFKDEKLGEMQSLAYDSRGVSTTIVQGNARVDLSDLDPEAKAELKIELRSENTYFLRTSLLSGVGIPNLAGVGQVIRDVPEWKHKKHFIVWKVYKADKFVFLASRNGNSTVRFGGRGTAIKKLLDVGASANVAKMSARNVSIEMIGKGGPIAIGVVRIKKNGDLWF